MNETIVKHLNFGESARDKVFEGIEKLTKAVSSTLGAGGKCVILEDEHGNPQITKDGVTVADTVILLDPVENMGSKLLKEAARKTVREAGDGTTTATVLAHAILTEAYKVIKSESRRDLKLGINQAVDKIIKYLDNISKPVTGERIKQVATISANNDVELGKIISEAFTSVDETGIVSMEINDSPETVVEKIEGIQYEKGFSSPNFVTNKGSNTAELDNSLVLIIDNKVDNIRKLEAALSFIMKEEQSLLLIADVDLQVKQALAMNKLKGNFRLNLVEPPIYGVNRKDILDDLCLLTGATLINEDLGDDMDLIQPEHFGKCTRVVSTATETLIQVKEIPAEIDGVVNEIKEKIKNTSNPNYKIRYEKRLARLLAKMAIVKVGANSEVELKEKKDRVEDAICATKAAIKEGIVPGGGVALLNAAQSITPKNIGEEVLLKAVHAPFNTILTNAGIKTIPHMVKGKGLDVVTGKTVSMVRSGIIDPLLVTKSALKNAASVATTILSTDCVINNLRTHESNR